MSGIGIIRVKKENKNRILRYMLTVEDATRPEIMAKLGLSLPTVGQICSELLEEGLLEESGSRTSSGGRRAAILKAAENKKIAVGVDITRHHIGFAAVNLRGGTVACSRQKYPFENNAQYLSCLMQARDVFLVENNIAENKLIGQAFSIPGIISKDQSQILYSHALGLEAPLSLNAISSCGIPVLFLNDASACCMTECRESALPDSFVYMMLSDTVGGALVIDGRIIEGKNNRAGEVGHMCIVPDGKQCYCGHRGHLDAYCSAQVLKEAADGSLPEFFLQLERGNPLHMTFFDEYLGHLSKTIYNLHIFTDLPVVIGGYVGAFLAPYLQELKNRVNSQDLFSSNEDYLYLGRCRAEAPAVGGALHLIEDYLKNREK